MVKYYLDGYKEVEYENFITAEFWHDRSCVAVNIHKENVEAVIKKYGKIKDFVIKILSDKPPKGLIAFYHNPPL